MAIPSHVDLLIVGGGPVGGALALMLADSGLRIAVVEARTAPAEDVRALALAHANQVVLDELGVWPAAAAAAIHAVHVSQQHSLGRVQLDRRDLDLPALGYVMPYAALAGAIHHRLAAQTAVHYLTGARVADIATLNGYAAATIDKDGAAQLITAQMVVLAEGGKLLDAVGITHSTRDYRQHAVVAEVSTDTPHANRAFERFAEDGPIALLPLPSTGPMGRYAVVWTRPATDPLNVAQMDDAAFLAALQARLGERAGLLTTVGVRTAFPLRLRWADRHQARRLAVVGNAAQTLHPVAGQGLNLGLRDALALARLIRATPVAQLGDTRMLARYAGLRRRDSLATVGFTDGLIQLFGEEHAAIRPLRGLGLFALGNCKPLRRGFAQRMVFGTP